MKNKFILFMVFIMLAGVLAGCGSDTVQEVIEDPDIAYYAFNSEPILTWDPSIMNSNGIIVLNNVYETLLRFNPDTSEFENLLAESYESSQDGLVWTFHIRKGVKFHDGSELTAEDVKFSIDRTIDMGKGASYIWYGLDEIKVIDDYTVDFHLSFPLPMDSIVSSPYAAFIMSKNAVESNSDTWFEEANEAGTGPYALENFKLGDEVILTQFQDYWKGWEGEHYDKILIKKVSETSSRRQMIEKGDATITMELPSEDIDSLKDNENVNVVVEPSFTNLMAFFNTKKEPLNNVNVRKAMSYAFPYEDVVKYAAGGYAIQSTGAIPNNLWGHGDDLYQYSSDLDKAKDLLETEGIKEGDLDILLTYMSGDEAEKKTAELYKAELSKIGVNLEIRAMPWESQWEMSRSENPEDRQDIFMMYWWVDVSSPYTWLNSLFRSEDMVFFNLSYYSNPEFDSMIDESYVISGTDIDKAAQGFIEAQEVLIEDSPCIFIYDKMVAWVTDKNLKGFDNNPSYPWVVFFYDIYPDK
jgi:peptide/nickel transport system substrate-binding protein